MSVFNFKRKVRSLVIQQLTYHVTLEMFQVLSKLSLLLLMCSRDCNLVNATTDLAHGKHHIQQCDIGQVIWGRNIGKNTDQRIVKLCRVASKFNQFVSKHLILWIGEFTTSITNISFCIELTYLVALNLITWQAIPLYFLHDYVASFFQKVFCNFNTNIGSSFPIELIATKRRSGEQQILGSKISSILWF